MASYTIEVADDEVGIVVLGESGFRFFGVDARVRAIEGLDFASAAAAARAASELIRAAGRSRGPNHRPAGPDRVADRPTVGG